MAICSTSCVETIFAAMSPLLQAPCTARLTGVRGSRAARRYAHEYVVASLDPIDSPDVWASPCS